MNSVLWLLWAALLAAAVSSTRNPWYLAVTALALASVWVAVDRVRPLGRPAPRLPLLAGAFLLPWSTVVNALLAHIGDRVLLRLPPWPVIGGPITWNAALYGALTGLALTSLLLGMSILHATLDRHELLRLVPVHQRTVALTIALALHTLPAFATAARDILETLQLRGRTSPLATLRVVVPAVLYRGMDYSLALAETLEVRGFGTSVPHRRQWPLTALLLLVGSFLAVGAAVSGFGIAWAVAYACLASAGLLSVRRAWPRLRTLRWGKPAALALGLLVFASIAFAVSLRDAASDLAYSPYPQLRWPGFTLIAGLVYLSLASPAFLSGRKPT